MKTKLIGAALAALWCAIVAAQTIYESKDKAGPVFSDTPSPGAKPTDLPPPNVIQTPSQAKQKPAAPAPASYMSLVVATPENGGTIHSNTGAFGVRVKVSPALRASAGDRIGLKLDGTLLPSTYSSGKINLSDSDWQAAANSSSVEHTLQAVVVDKAGSVKIESAPVSFFVHRAAVGGRRGR